MQPPAFFTPTVLPPPPRDQPWYRLLGTLRRNAIQMWPDHAYDCMVLEQTFLGRRRLLVNDPAAIQQVLIENAANYGRSPASIRIFRPIVGEGLLLSEGEAWRHQRRTIAPALAPRSLPMLARHVAAVVADAVAGLDAAARTGAPVDMLAAMQGLTLHAAARSMFSVDMNAHARQLRDLITRFAGRLGRPYLLDMLLPAHIPNLHDLARRRFRRRWVALMDAIIAERTRLPPDAGAEAQDLFDLMRAARDPQTGAAFSPAALRDQMATLIVAGHETTALTLFWALVLLAGAPDVQARLAEEVRGLDLGPANAAAALPHLTYTRAVAQEALRLYPPAFAVIRRALGPDQVAGVPVGAGALIMVAPWVLHRHRRLWQHPDRFDPSRFLPGAPAIPRFAWLPFGAGPRVCVGSHFALAETVLVLAGLVQAFEVTRVDTDPVLPAAVVTTQPARAPLFRLRRRG